MLEQFEQDYEAAVTVIGRLIGLSDADARRFAAASSADSSAVSTTQGASWAAAAHSTRHSDAAKAAAREQAARLRAFPETALLCSQCEGALADFCTGAAARGLTLYFSSLIGCT